MQNGIRKRLVPNQVALIARLKSSLLAKPDIDLRRCLDFYGTLVYIKKEGVIMNMKCISVYLHLVWATWDGMNWIEPVIERRVYRMIVSAIRNLSCTTLAINGMPDHVHLLIKSTTTSTIADIIKRAKGTSSRLINQSNLITDHFRWGTGYGAFSVSRWDTDKIVHYIQHQKEHHQGGNLIEDLESLP